MSYLLVSKPRLIILGNARGPSYLPTLLCTFCINAVNVVDDVVGVGVTLMLLLVV